MKRQKIKLVIFDLWGTLLYFHQSFDPISMLISGFKLVFPYRRFMKIFERALQTKKWKSEYAAYSALCKAFHLNPTEKRMQFIRKVRMMIERKMKIYPHTAPMLKQLKKQGYKIGLLSNSAIFSIQSVKRKTKLLDNFDYKVFSYDIGTIKPDTKIFKVMLKKARCKPGEALMIGDTFKDDIAPARKIGMNAIHFKNYKKLRKEIGKFGIFI